MGMPIALQHHWTIEDVWALPECGERYEVVDGVLLVSPAPSLVHQRAVRVLLELLQRYVSQFMIGEALPAPLDVVMADDTMVQPDVCPAAGR
ncbi:MAG: Uma2 family endonuclease [Gemmatimonadaceae bacterium]|nr:Uma2 family endonuclease [Gemmatimonadaceae bacterium]